MMKGYTHFRKPLYVYNHFGFLWIIWPWSTASTSGCTPRISWVNESYRCGGFMCDLLWNFWDENPEIPYVLPRDSPVFPSAFHPPNFSILGMFFVKLPMKLSRTPWNAWSRLNISLHFCAFREQELKMMNIFWMMNIPPWLLGKSSGYNHHKPIIEWNIELTLFMSFKSNVINHPFGLMVYSHL